MVGGDLRPFWAGFSAFPAVLHAHAVLIEDPAHVIAYLAPLCEVIRGRFVTLRQAGASTWGRLPNVSPSTPPPAQRILAVMDEFANLADAFPTNERRSCGTVPA